MTDMLSVLHLNKVVTPKIICICFIYGHFQDVEDEKHPEKADDATKS